MKNKYVIATIKSWNIKIAKEFILKNSVNNFYLITNKEKLIPEKINKIKPRYIFFPHWSWKIPEKIYKNYECVIFHMTDVPFGRGGSPLQNLIINGIKKTKISAIKAVDEIDAGPVYLKRELSLNGSANEIFKRMSQLIFYDMIPYIIGKKPKPISQKGKIVMFKRRKPEESNIIHLDNINKIYDSIRMLDAEGYPYAFIETGKLHIEFSDAIIKKGAVFANAKIKIKEMKK